MKIVEEALKKFGIKDNRVYGLLELYKVMDEIGIVTCNRWSFASDFVNRNIKNGNLVLPQRPERKPWKIYGYQLREIVEAFMPGGSREWKYATTNAEDERQTNEAKVISKDNDKPHDHSSLATL